MIANKEQLTDLYSNGLKSTGEIASIFNVSRSTILRWMLNFNIPRRNKTEANECNSFAKNLENKIGEPLKVFLQREYVRNKRSKKNIKEELGISERAVTLYLKRYEIKMRSPQEATNVTFGLENMPTELTDIEKQVLYGSLLGDGALTIRKESKNATFTEGHCLKQREYLEWKAEQLKRFKPIVRELNLQPSKTTGKTYGKCQLYTSPAPVLNELYKKFYSEKKTITRGLLDELTPLGLAIWYMDDGSYIKDKNSRSSVLYTMCFSEEEHEILKEYFSQKWNLDVRIVHSRSKISLFNIREKEYSFLRFPTGETPKFLKIINKYMHPSMHYKTGRYAWRSGF